MPPRTGTRSLDYYAAWRCACGHLFYRDDQLGAQCRWERCMCIDHRPPQPQAVQR